MKSQNIQKIMAIAKAQKPMLKMVITVTDTIINDCDVRSERKPGTKITCIDELRSVYKVDEVDNSLVATNALFINVSDEELVDELLRL